MTNRTPKPRSQEGPVRSRIPATCSFKSISGGEAGRSAPCGRAGLFWPNQTVEILTACCSPLHPPVVTFSTGMVMVTAAEAAGRNTCGDGRTPAYHQKTKYATTHNPQSIDRSRWDRFRRPPDINARPHQQSSNRRAARGMASFASAFAGAGGSSRQQRRDGGGMNNPIHFQPPAVAVPRSTMVRDEKGKPVALHTVRVRVWGGVGVDRCRGRAF